MRSLQNYPDFKRSSSQEHVCEPQVRVWMRLFCNKVPNRKWQSAIVDVADMMVQESADTSELVSALVPLLCWPCRVCLCRSHKSWLGANSEEVASLYLSSIKVTINCSSDINLNSSLEPFTDLGFNLFAVWVLRKEPRHIVISLCQSLNCYGPFQSNDGDGEDDEVVDVPPCRPIQIRNLEDLIRQLQHHTRHTSPCGSEDIRMSETDVDRHYRQESSSACSESSHQSQRDSRFVYAGRYRHPPGRLSYPHPHHHLEEESIYESADHDRGAPCGDTPDSER